MPIRQKSKLIPTFPDLLFWHTLYPLLLPNPARSGYKRMEQAVNKKRNIIRMQTVTYIQTNEQWRFEWAAVIHTQLRTQPEKEPRSGI
jgi:hypothetical protein